MIDYIRYTHQANDPNPGVICKYSILLIPTIQIYTLLSYVVHKLILITKARYQTT